MKIDTFKITTCMGMANNISDLPFLSKEEFNEFNNIGYTGMSTSGKKTNREEYLNSLGYGVFKIGQIKFDNGNFIEKFIITRVLNI